MDGSLLNALLQVVNDYGVPLAVLIVVFISFVRGYIVPGRLFDIEHEQRLKAEDRLDKAISAMKDQTDLLQDIEREVLRGQPQPRP